MFCGPDEKLKKEHLFFQFTWMNWQIVLRLFVIFESSPAKVYIALIDIFYTTLSFWNTIGHNSVLDGFGLMKNIS